MTQSATTNHEVIRRWVESRHGRPSVVQSTQGKSRGRSGGLLRIDFEPSEDSFHEVSWDEFFDTFDQNKLAFLYQEKTASGRKSRFNKFVSRDTVDVEASSAEEQEEDEEDLEDEDLDEDEEDEEDDDDEDDDDEQWDDDEDDDDEDEDDEDRR